MTLNCPNCDAEIKSKYVNVKNLVARCDSCNHIFRFEKMLPAKSKSDEITIPQPQRVHIKNEMGQYIIEWRWRGLHLFFSTLSTIILIGFILYVFYRIGSQSIEANNIRLLSPSSYSLLLGLCQL